MDSSGLQSEPSSTAADGAELASKQKEENAKIGENTEQASEATKSTSAGPEASFEPPGTLIAEKNQTDSIATAKPETERVPSKSSSGVRKENAIKKAQEDGVEQMRQAIITHGFQPPQEIPAENLLDLRIEPKEGCFMGSWVLKKNPDKTYIPRIMEGGTWGEWNYWIHTTSIYQRGWIDLVNAARDSAPHQATLQHFFSALLHIECVPDIRAAANRVTARQIDPEQYMIEARNLVRTGDRRAQAYLCIQVLPRGDVVELVESDSGNRADDGSYGRGIAWLAIERHQMVLASARQQHRQGRTH